MKRCHVALTMGLVLAFGFSDAYALGPDAPDEASLRPDETIAGAEAYRPPVGEVVSLGEGNTALTMPVLRWTDESSDGKLVVFATDEALLPATDGHASDVFVRNQVTGVVSQVSIGVGGVKPNDTSVDPSVSADGRYVAFASAASNLVVGDTNGKYDVFVRDLVAKTTKRVSVVGSNGQANGHSHTPQISDNGKVVSFLSGATNLSPADKGFHRDVYARDLSTSATQLISVSLTGGGGNNHSLRPTVDATGRWVVFNSTATNLSPRADLGTYLRDRSASRPTRLPQRSTSGSCGGQPYTHNEKVLPVDPTISANGRYVTYVVTQKACVDLPRTPLGPDEVLVRHDRTTGGRSLLTRASSWLRDYETCHETLDEHLGGPLQIANSGTTYAFEIYSSYTQNCSLSAGDEVFTSYNVVTPTFRSSVTGCEYCTLGSASIGASLHPTKPTLLVITRWGVGSVFTGYKEAVFKVTFP